MFTSYSFEFQTGWVSEWEARLTTKLNTKSSLSIRAMGRQFNMKPQSIFVLTFTCSGLFGLNMVVGQSAYTVTPLQVVVDHVHAVSVTKNGNDLFIDFGEDSFAGLEMTIPNPAEGQKLTIMLGEKLSAPGTIESKPGGSVRFYSTELVLKQGQQVYRIDLASRDKRRAPEELGGVMPFRYVQIQGAPTGLEKNNFAQLVAHYPFDDGAAHFECSDPKLNAVWNLCQHTIKATSFGGLFIDGDRERKPYEADAYIDQLGWYCCTTDLTLPRISWQYLIKNPTWPTEWILFSVLLAWNDYQFTGDTVGIAHYYNDLKAKTLLQLERPDGLISTVQPLPGNLSASIHIDKIRDLVDWPPGERDGNEMCPFNTVVNTFHAIALQRMAQLARALNHPDDASEFEAAAKRTIASVNDKLFDSTTGLYVDGEGSHHSSAHANFFPLAFGLVPAERQGKIVAFLSGKGMPCSVYGAQFFLEALFDHGHATDALALMTADTDRSWTHMLAEGSTMTWEAWDAKYKPNQDWNHAWGAAAANLLPRKLLGIEPLEPGFTRILIQPRASSLKWAEMRMPTIRGSVYVRYEQRGASPSLANPTLTVEIPQGVTARIGLPVSLADGPANATLDGHPVIGTVVSNTLFLDGIPAGHHSITR